MNYQILQNKEAKLLLSSFVRKLLEKYYYYKFVKGNVYLKNYLENYLIIKRRLQ